MADKRTKTFRIQNISFTKAGIMTLDREKLTQHYGIIEVEGKIVKRTHMKKEAHLDMIWAKIEELRGEINAPKEYEITAVKTIALIKKAKTLEEVDSISKDDERETVIDAAALKRIDLNE